MSERLAGGTGGGGEGVNRLGRRETEMIRCAAWKGFGAFGVSTQLFYQVCAIGKMEVEM